MSDSGLGLGLAMLAPIALGAVVVVGVGGYLLGSDEPENVSPDKAIPAKVLKIHPSAVQKDILIVPNGRIKLSEPLAEGVDLNNLYYLTFDKYNAHVCPSETYAKRACYLVEKWLPVSKPAKTQHVTDQIRMSIN